MSKQITGKAMADLLKLLGGASSVEDAEKKTKKASSETTVKLLDMMYESESGRLVLLEAFAAVFAMGEDTDDPQFRLAYAALQIATGALGVFVNNIDLCRSAYQGLVHPDDVERLLEELETGIVLGGETARRDGRPTTIEYRVRDKDEEEGK